MYVKSSIGSVVMPPNIRIDANIVPAKSNIDQAEDSKPVDIPDRIKVAVPVSADFLISWTGFAYEPVSARRLNTSYNQAV